MKLIIKRLPTQKEVLRGIGIGLLGFILLTLAFFFAVGLGDGTFKWDLII